MALSPVCDVAFHVYRSEPGQVADSIVDRYGTETGKCNSKAIGN